MKKKTYIRVLWLNILLIIALSFLYVVSRHFNLALLESENRWLQHTDSFFGIMAFENLIIITCVRDIHSTCGIIFSGPWCLQIIQHPKWVLCFSYKNSCSSYSKVRFCSSPIKSIFTPWIWFLGFNRISMAISTFIHICSSVLPSACSNPYQHPP